MRCKHCHAILVAIPHAGGYVAGCGSCGAGYHITLEEVRKPSRTPEELQAVREYFKPGSY